MKRLSIFFAALMACTLSFAETDYSTTYTSNVTVAAGDNNTSEADIVIGENTYKGMKAGTSKKKGSIKIIVPANQTNLHIHAIAWKGVKDAIVNIAGAACTPATLTLADNAGISSNSPFTISGDMSEDYYFNVALTGITKETTLTLSCDKRFVVFGVNAVASQAVEATDIALDQNALELQQYKSAKLVATLTPAEATTTVEWKSSNEKVATVGNNGVVTAVGIGTANITATAGAHVATCAVTVSAATIYSCSEIVELAKDLANNEVLANGKYVVRGYVTEIVGTPSSDMEKYGNYSVWMADAKDGENVFEAYAATPIDDKKIANVGDFVEIVGDITKYKSTIETNKGTATIAILIPAPKMYTITATANDDAMGTITGAGEYEENATATLTATANEGYEFVNWTVGEETKTDNPLTITVAADMTITANFQEKATPAEVVTMLWKEDSYTFNTGVHARDMDYYDGKLYVMNKNDKKIYTIDAVTGKADAEAYVALDNLTGYSVCADNAGNLIATEGAYGMTSCLKASKVVNGVATYLGNTATATIGRIDYLDVYGDIESAEGAMIVGASTNTADNIAIWTMKNGALENAATPTILAGKRGKEVTNADVCIVDQNQFWTSGAGQQPMLFTLNADKTDATVQTLNVSCDLGGVAAFTLNKKDYVVLPSGKAGAVALYDVTDIANPEMVETTAFVGLNVSGLTHVAIAANVNGNSAYIYVFAPNGGAAAYQFTPAHTPTSVENSAIVAPKAVKVLRNGQVLIVRDGKTYDMMGQIVE